MKLTKGIHHVAIKCKGVEAFEKTIHFYHDILGMEIVRQWGEGGNTGMMLDTGNSVMEIFANGEDEPGQGALRHIAFCVDNVEQCVDACVAEGYEVLIAPKDVIFATKEPYSARVAFVKGPAGEEVEFFCEY